MQKNIIKIMNRQDSKTKGKSGMFFFSFVILFSLIISSFLPSFLSVTKTVEAVFNKQINYQGKLTNSAGVAVANGTYNMEFKLYDAASGGTTIWTETRTTTNKVQVTNGLFSVMLGEVNAFTTENFNQTLYLGVNIGGTGTPGWDGEMTPRKKLGAVPAAVVTETANITNDATTSSAVYPTWVTTNSGGMPIKTSSAQLSFIPSTGALTISGYVYSPNVDTSSAVALNLGTVTQNALTIGRVGANTTINGAVVNINSAAASALNITSGTTGALTLDSGTTGIINIGTGTGGKTINIGTNNTTADTILIGSALDTIKLAKFTTNGFVKTNSTDGTLSVDTNSYQLAGSYESPLTFSSGLTRTINAVANDLITGKTGGQTVIGGTAVGDYLTYKSTTGAGTTTGIAHQFVGGTNGGTTAMTILNNGNVGIGTIAPGYKLNVIGSGSRFSYVGAGTELSIKNFSTNNSYSGQLSFFKSHADTETLAATQTDEQLGVIAFYAGSNVFEYAGGASISAFQDGVAGYTTPTRLEFSTQGSGMGQSHKLLLDSTGYTGFDVTSPTNIISLSGTAARTIWMERNTTAATAGQGLTLSSGGAIAGTADLAGGDLTLKSGISTGTGTSAMHFFTATAGSTGSTDNTPTEKMTILGNGNVGIGTTAPGNLLTVSKNTAGYTTSLLKVEQLDATSWAIAQIDRQNAYRVAGTQYSTAGTADWYTGTLYNGGSLNSFYSISTTSSLSGSKLVIDNSNGNVGIGTTAPGALLDITNTGGTSPSILFRSLGYTESVASGFTGYNKNQFTPSTFTKSGGLAMSMTEANTVYIAGAPKGLLNAGITNSSGLKIASNVLTRVDSGYGLYVDAPTGATSNYAAVFNGGNVGVGTVAPATKLEIVGDGSNPPLRINSGSVDANAEIEFFDDTSQFLKVGYNGADGWNQIMGTAYHSLVFGTSNSERMRINPDGRIFMGATADATSSSKLYLTATGTANGSTAGVTGILGDYTFNNGGGSSYVQVGNRFVINNAPTTNANTSIGEIIRTVDNTTLGNLVRGLDITSNAGSNTAGTNTGLRATGGTFGVQGITSGLAGGASVPAALYGENTGTTQGDVLRLYSSTVTSANSFATYYHDTSTFTGTGLLMKFATGSGGFSGNFLDFQKNNASLFKVTNAGILSLGLSGTAATSAVCSSLANGTAPTAGVAYELRDCSATPVADYAEMYPVESGIEYGDIVAVGSEMISTYDSTDGNVNWNKEKGKITKLIKSTSPYQRNVIGVVSDNYSDFSSTGNNIKEVDNPMPVALSGRVPVKISNNSEEINPGDYITTSSEVGKATKATKAGTSIGKALEKWVPNNGQDTVMIYIEQGYYDGGDYRETTFNGLTFFNADTKFVENVLFESEVEFNVPPLFNKDTAGFAIIKAGTNKVDVVFETPYIAQPVVSAMITLEDNENNNMTDEEANIFFGEDIKTVVTNKTQNKFTIRINKNATRDIRFSWIALQVKDPNVFISVIPGMVIDNPTFTPPTDSTPTTPEITTTSTPTSTPDSTPITDTTTSPVDSVPPASTPPATLTSEPTPTVESTPTPKQEVPPEPTLTPDPTSAPEPTSAV